MTAPALTNRQPDSGVFGTTGLVPGPVPVWVALFVNVLAFSGLPTLIPIPTSLGQLVTQGALVAAVLLALLANPRGIIRPNLFLVLLTMLAVVASRVDLPRMSSDRLHHGSVAVDTLVGQLRLRAPPRPSGVPARRLVHRLGGRGTRARRRLLLRPCGPSRLPRSPTTRPSCWVAPSCCGSAES
jgi:hypothetical protein